MVATRKEGGGAGDLAREEEGWRGVTHRRGGRMVTQGWREKEAAAVALQRAASALGTASAAAARVREGWEGKGREGRGIYMD